MNSVDKAFQKGVGRMRVPLCPGTSDVRWITPPPLSTARGDGHNLARVKCPVLATSNAPFYMGR